MDVGDYSSVGEVTVQTGEEGGMGVCARVTPPWVVKYCCACEKVMLVKGMECGVMVEGSGFAIVR